MANFNSGMLLGGVVCCECCSLLIPGCCCDEAGRESGSGMNRRWGVGCASWQRSRAIVDTCAGVFVITCCGSRFETRRAMHRLCVVDTDVVSDVVVCVYKLT